MRGYQFFALLIFSVLVTVRGLQSSIYDRNRQQSIKDGNSISSGIILKPLFNHTLKTDACEMAFAKEYCSQDEAQRAAASCAQSSNNATCANSPQSCIRYLPTSSYCYSSWKDPRCTSPEPENCYWYAGCLEDRFHCGPSGYPIAYGNKYCRRFQDAICPNLSDAGKKWCLSTRQCLMESSINLFSNTTNVNCAKLEDIEFGIHPNCYTSGNPSFCQLGITDIMTIVRHFDAGDLFSRRTLQQFLVVLKNCASGIVDPRVLFLQQALYN